MSDPMRPPPSAGRGCLQAIAVLAGLVLLLPGICVIVIAATDFKAVLRDTAAISIIVNCLLVSAGGVALIWWAVRRR